MTKELEIEAKNLLTEAEFKLLLDTFSIKENQFVTQSNHYFETSDLSLKNNRCALRIREKEGTYTLTLKQQEKEGVLETHQTLSKEEAANLINGQALLKGEVKDELLSLRIDLSALVFIGTLKTERAEMEYKNGLLVFDKSFYFDCIDYELEYEGSAKETAWSTLKQLLASHQIPVREVQHKIARFFALKQKQRSYHN